MAAWAAYNTFRDPGGSDGAAARQGVVNAYRRAWAYYRNASSEVYTSDYVTAKDLYTYTRLIYNPYPAIVDFYVDNVFQTAPEVLSDKSVLVMPVVTSGETDELKIAIAQLEQWGNWQSESPRIVRYAAAASCVLVEVDDDLDREIVTERIIWPSWLKDKELDSTGNVKAYALEYKAYDPETKGFYTFTKEVDGDFFIYKRDAKFFDPPSRRKDDVQRKERGVYYNPYEFVSAVFIKHDDDGDGGEAAAVTDTTKIDEVNSLVSHQHDRTHKGIEAGKVMITAGAIDSVTGTTGRSESGQSGGISTAGYDSRRDWVVWKMPDGEVGDLDSGFDPTKADSQIERMLKSFERDYPELQAGTIIENSAELSGAALDRKLAPSQKKLDRAASRYHQQIIKLRQMQIAIGGWRFNNGDWTRKDGQQQRFKPFGLESYAKGELNFGLKRSLLVQSTPMEEEELKAKKMERAKNAGGIVDPLEQLLIAGYSQEQAAAIIDRQKPEGGE